MRFRVPSPVSEGDHSVKRSGGRWIAAVMVAAVAALVAALAVPSFRATSFAASSSPAPAGEVAVAQGLGPVALKNATVAGSTPAATPEIVSFILRGRNLFDLQSAVEAGQSPDLTVAEFASRYGQTAGDFDNALSVQQQQYKVPAVAAHDGLAGLPAQQVHGTTANPYLPTSIAS